MLRSKLILTAAVAASVLGGAMRSALATTDSIVIQPSFGSAQTTGGAALLEPNGNPIPVASGNNNVYIYSSGQTGIYTLNFTANSTLAAGEQFASVEFGLSGSSGLSFVPSSYVAAAGPWVTNGGVTVNGSYGPNPNTFTEIAASVGKGGAAISSAASIGSVNVSWNGLTAETLQISDGSNHVGQDQFASESSTAPGTINPTAIAADTWTVNFVPLFSADTNYDGKVGQADFGVIAGNFGTHVNNGVQGGALFPVDNGNVGQDDFGALAGQFGSVYAPGLVAPGVSLADLPAFAPAGTPEPASLGVLALGGMALIARRRKA